jgi:hypothetical protein
VRELFVYWRTADAEAAERAARAWQADLQRACPGLRVALFRRADATGDGLATLMETYAGAALDATLEHRIADEGEARLRPWLAGPRKVEVFVRLTAA